MNRKIFGFLVILILLTIAGQTPDQASANKLIDSTPQPSKAQNLSVSDYTVYLPCVQKDGCPGYPSPFSVQIAGLSDIPAPPGMSPAQIKQFRAQYIAALDASFPTLITALRESGAGWARIYIDWSQIQPDPSTFNWDWYDSKLEQVASAGVQIIATVSNPPSWAAVSGNPNNPDCSNRIAVGMEDEFYVFLQQLINRYKIAPYNIHTWELMNEPDAIDGYRCNGGMTNYGNHGDDYARLVQGAAPIIKTADPIARVIMGGIAYDWFYAQPNPPYYDGSLQGKFNRYFLDAVAQNGGFQALDAINFHYFPDYAPEWERWTVGDLPSCGVNTLRDPAAPKYSAFGPDVVAKGSHLLNRMTTCFGVAKPFWITEVGQHGKDAQTLDNQARYVFMVYARGLALGAENISWYALKIVPTVTPDDNQGLLYDSRDPGLENQPKPAFYAYKTLTQELTGYRYSATYRAQPGSEAYMFVNPCNKWKIIAWHNDISGSAPLVLSNSKSVKLVYRPTNTGAAVSQTVVDGGAGDLDGIVNGSITINLTIEPVIIQPTTS